MKPIRRRPSFHNDLLDIWLFIAEDSPASADAFVDRVTRAVQPLAEFPKMGAMRADISPGLRYLPIGAYVLLYRERPDCVELIRVLHGRRDLTGPSGDDG